NAGLCSINSATAPQTLSCGPTTLASLATFSVHITATTSAAECTLYANTATATTTNDGGGNSSATITCNLASITVTKTADAPSVSAGTPIGFTVTLTDAGAGTATGVTLTDALPGGNALTPVHWSIDSSTGNPAAFSISGPDGSQALSLAGQPISLGPGASLSVHVTAPTTATSCAVYNNSASVTTTNDGSDSMPASETVLCANVTILKTRDAVVVNAGDPIGFTVTVSNTGAGTATGVTVSDPLPAGGGSGLSWSIDIQSNPGLCSVTGSKPSQVLSCGPISLGAGGSFNVHITATTSAGECTIYDNTATATTTGYSGVNSSAIIVCRPANVTIFKSADAASVSAGTPIGFTVTVRNRGAGIAKGVMVSDPLPAGSGSGLTWSINSQTNAGLCSINPATAPQTLSCGPTNVAGGTSFSVHITATTSAGECTLYANTASVTTTNDGSGVSSATITCNAADPALPGLPNTSALDVSLGGAIPDAPMRIPDLALTILALIAGLGMVVVSRAGLRRHYPGFLAVGLLAIMLGLAPTSLSVGDLPSQPVVALAPATQLIGSKAVSVVPPARPAVEIFHRVTVPIIPSRLRIPSIGVDAAVGAVGLRADGSMDVPDNLWTSSWWAAGSRPGQAGNAVIAGHRGVGTPALFSHLENVKPGDWIYISDGAGDELIYVVTRVASLDLSNSTRVAVFENGPSSQLVLITCFGAYIANARTYDHRLVVFGRPLLPIT
ncbi:MAG TPA: sortase, partial [Candidatus Dormibacteraeota bacterium]